MPKSYPLIGLVAYDKVIRHNPDVVVMGVLSPYVKAIIDAGGSPILLPDSLPSEQATALLDRLDGIVFTGGGDIHPRQYGQEIMHTSVDRIDEVRDRFEIDLIREVLENDLPMLGICRGHQVLNVALGGTLWQDIGTQIPDSLEHHYFRDGFQWDYLPHDIMIDASSRLAQLLGTTHTMVNSLHHQAVRDLADGLQVTAWSEDEVIEAMEMPSQRFAVSVQWHPECIVDNVPAMRGLFRGLIEAV